MRKNTYTFAPSGLLSSHFYTAQAHLQRHRAAHSGSVLPTPIISKDSAPQPCPQSSLIEAIPQLGFPFLGDSSLCHADSQDPSCTSAGVIYLLEGWLEMGTGQWDCCEFPARPLHRMSSSPMRANNSGPVKGQREGSMSLPAPCRKQSWTPR